jgi:hypothetical protein
MFPQQMINLLQNHLEIETHVNDLVNKKNEKLFEANQIMN